MSNPLARDGEPRHRRCEAKHLGVCWWGVFPSLLSIWLIGRAGGWRCGMRDRD
jgi:hypothetical protein